MSEIHLEVCLAAMLDAAENQGFSRDRMIVGVVGTVDSDGSLPYWTHVGRQTNSDEAVHLQIVADVIAREAHDQAVAACCDETCPACGSPRMVIRFRREPGNRMPNRFECMDCDYRGPDR